MRRQTRFVLTGIFAAAVLAAAASPAAPADKKAEEWSQLFNGKDLAGWDTIELLAVGGTCVHRVNGKTNMVLTNARQVVDGKEVPLTRGKIQLQSEGAEVFYRNIAVRPLKAIPEQDLE